MGQDRRNRTRWNRWSRTRRWSLHRRRNSSPRKGGQPSAPSGKLPALPRVARPQHWSARPGTNRDKPGKRSCTDQDGPRRAQAAPKEATPAKELKHQERMARSEHVGPSPLQWCPLRRCWRGSLGWCLQCIVHARAGTATTLQYSPRSPSCDHNHRRNESQEAV